MYKHTNNKKTKRTAQLYEQEKLMRIGNIELTYIFCTSI